MATATALPERYGDKAGFRYYEDEDLGIFWSNDPKVPVRQMIKPFGLQEAPAELARVKEMYRKASVLDY